MIKCPVCSSDKILKYITVKNYDYLICHRCRAVFLAFIDIDEQTKRHSSSEYKQSRIRVESQYSQHNRYLVDVMLQTKPSGAVLDIGCGAGFLVKAMCDFGYNAIDVDLGDENVIFARDNLNVTVLNQDFLTITGEYDIITAHQLIEHLPEPNAFIAKIRSMLRTDGVIILTTPNLSLVKKFANLPIPILGDGLGHPPNHCILFEPVTIRWILEHNGFEVKAIRNNPTGFKTKSRIRHYADAVMNTLGLIGLNMIIIAVPR